MQLITLASSLSAIISLVSAATAGPFGLDNLRCQQQFYEVSANSTNVKFVGVDQTQQNQSSITALILLASVAPSNFTEQFTNGTFPFSGTFNISGTLCTPLQGAKNGSAIQLLVHGVGYDSSYWDFSVSRGLF